MTNWDKIKEELDITDVGHGGVCKAIHRVRNEDDCASRGCIKCREWLKQEYKPSILDKAEKEYLSAVIRPYRDRIVKIKKTEHDEPKYEYIVMQLIFRNCFDDYLEFPLFNKDEYYKNMEIDKEYTLEELGL